MAVSFDNATGAAQQYASSRTISHTCSGSDRVLVVFVTRWSGTAVPSVTYAGVSMTYLGQAEGSSDYISVFYLIGPATGANNVVITFTGTQQSIVGIVSFNGANNVKDLTTAGSYSTSINVPSANGNMVADSRTCDLGNSPDASQTLRFDLDSGIRRGSTKPSTSSSTTMSWSGSRSVNNHAGVDIVAGTQSTDYTMAVIVSTFTYTGINSIFNRGWNLFTNFSQFTLTGINTTLSKSLNIITAIGEFTLTGISSVFQKGVGMIASLAEFALTGINTNILRPIRNLIATSAEYTLTGIDLAFNRGWAMIVELGSFTLIGINVVINRGYTLMAQLSENTLTGINATLNKFLNLVAAKGSFILTGVSVNLLRPIRNMAVSVKSFTLSLVDIIISGRGDWTWTTRTKPSTSYTKRTKPDTTWTTRT